MRGAVISKTFGPPEAPRALGCCARRCSPRRLAQSKDFSSVIGGPRRCEASQGDRIITGRDRGSPVPGLITGWGLPRPPKAAAEINSPHYRKVFV